MKGDARVGGCWLDSSEDADLGHLPGDIRGRVLRRRRWRGGLCLEGEREGEADGKKRNQFHRDTIAEDGVV